MKVGSTSTARNCRLTSPPARVIEDTDEPTQTIMARLMSALTREESEYTPSESEGDGYITSASEGDGQQGSRIDHIMEGPGMHNHHDYAAFHAHPYA